MITYIRLPYKGIEYTVSLETVDYERIKHFKWSITDCSRHGTQKLYVRRREYAGPEDKNGKTIYMHRELCGFPAGLCIDHWDGNGLNNCRVNFRIVTVNENAEAGRQVHTKYNVARMKLDIENAQPRHYL